MEKTTYFRAGVRAELRKRHWKVSVSAELTHLSEKTIQRLRSGQEVSEDTKQAIAEAFGKTIQALEHLGRSYVLDHTWVPVDSKRKDVDELTEVLDAYHLFRALSGQIRGFEITRPVQGAGEAANLDRVVKLQEFLLSLMLLAPVDQMFAGRMDTTIWDDRLRDLRKLGYSLFVGAGDVGERIVSLNLRDDVCLLATEDGPRRYFFDVHDPFDEDDESIRSQEEENFPPRPDHL